MNVLTVEDTISAVSLMLLIVLMLSLAALAIVDVLQNLTIKRKTLLLHNMQMQILEQIRKEIELNGDFTIISTATGTGFKLGDLESVGQFWRPDDGDSEMCSGERVVLGAPEAGRDGDER
jgi:PhoPQ-activated pathogenicity-related protein